MRVKVSKIEELFMEFLNDADANAEFGNKAAGRRARRASVELCKLLKEYRAEGVIHDKAL